MPLYGDILQANFFDLRKFKKPFLKSWGVGQHNYRCRRHRLQSSVLMKTTVQSDHRWMP